ncbi:hypothetical protein Tco_1012492, partial [Tanacetum coccineum]
WAYAFHQDRASSVRVPVANVTLSSSVPVGITSTCHCCSLIFQSCGNAITSRGYGMIHNDGDRDNDAYDDDRDDDERDISGNSSSGTKKYQGSNSSDGGNTGDGVKTAGGVIGSSDEIEFSKELKELLSDEVGK